MENFSAESLNKLAIKIKFTLEEILNLSIQIYESYYLSGDFEKMEELATIILQNDQTPVELVKINKIRILSFIAQKKLDRALTLGIETLSDLKIEFLTAPQARLTFVRSRLSFWANHAPMNFSHKLYLVEAEHERVLGNKLKALELYDRAILGARENQYIQEEALANEIAAKFYLNWGKEKVAAGYIQAAYSCYVQWGAKAKIRHLEQHYPELLRPILQQKKQLFDPLQTLSTLSSFANSNSSSGQTSFTFNDAFDLTNILRSAQALTETLELDELLKKLSQIIQ